MGACGRKALTLLSSVFAVCGLGLLGIAVSTDYWLYMEEGTVLPQNQTTEVKMALHAGLWRVCFFAGTGLTCPPVNRPCLCVAPESPHPHFPPTGTRNPEIKPVSLLDSHMSTWRFYI